LIPFCLGRLFPQSRPVIPFITQGIIIASFLKNNMKTSSLPLILLFVLVVVFGSGCLPPPPGAAHPKAPAPPGAFINQATPFNATLPA
jgi:hypothetical protein